MEARRSYRSSGPFQPRSKKTDLRYADTRADRPDGLLGGHLVATGDGGLALGTPVGVDKEKESYDLTLRFTGRNGGPATEADTTLFRLDADQTPIDVYNPPRAPSPCGRPRADG